MVKMICVFCDTEIKKEDNKKCPNCGIKFLPQLLSNDSFKLEDINFSNKFISKKRDGVYGFLCKRGLLGRSLKRMANPKIQEYFMSIYNKIPNNLLLIGEVYSHGHLIGDIAGRCNSKLGKELLDNTKIYIFGLFDSNNPNMVFSDRYKVLKNLNNVFNDEKIKLVEQVRVFNKKEAEEYYNKCLDDGYEGSVIMDGDNIHKFGRLTIKSNQGFKLKPKRPDDLKIIAVNERMINLNESEIDERGYKFKKSSVNNRIGSGIAGTFTCLLDNGLETKITINGTELFRKKIWENRNDYIGRYAVVESMDYGVKDRIRHAKLIRIQERVEK